MHADIGHKGKKTYKTCLFEVRLNWLDAARGILTGNNTGNGIYVATPPDFGGEKGDWSPEHLLVGAVCGSFMTTYLAYAKKADFHPSHLDCSAIGHVQVEKGSYRFTHINLYPQVFIANEALRKKATLALEKTYRHCPVANSLRAELFYHSQVLLDAHPRPSEKA
jgi:organic hydroperoxide reductase OsmC/OhrA